MTTPSPTPPSTPTRGPITMLLDLFSSIWFGVFLLACLFVYSSIGSAGVPVHPNILDPASWVSVRQLRPFELTEFEWFHWWPFNLLIALICASIITATLRRIRLRWTTLGVWMIHTGIIILAVGSVWYFSTKVEGDAPVIRRQLVINVPGAEPVSMAALPGNRTTFKADDEEYSFEIANIDPEWEIRSGDDIGKKAYSVTVAVQTETQQFMRQLLAGYPQYTEDVIRTDNPQQPMQRAIKAIGKPLVDEALELSLDYDPQEYFYLMSDRSLYLRELGSAEWIQRPIEDLPRYNDYIANWNDVWTAPGENTLPIDPIEVEILPSESNDPLADTTFRIRRYLRYATLENRRRPDPNGRVDPAISVRLSTPDGESQRYQLVAFDTQLNTALEGTLLFSWIDSKDKIENLTTRREPIIKFSLPELDIEIEEPIRDAVSMNPNLAFDAIEGTNYSYRVRNFHDELVIDDEPVSVAIVEIKSPERTFTRWVFTDPARNRDMSTSEMLTDHDAVIPLDKRIETIYEPGTRPPAPIMILAGPGESDLSILITKITGQPRLETLSEGADIEITNDVTLTIERYASRTTSETKPFVVPRAQRDRDLRELLSMIYLEIPDGSDVIGEWLPFHMFAFESEDEVLRRFPYKPRTVTLADGRQFEFMFSRTRQLLPTPVVLEDFQIDTHIGGFTGRTTSILNWNSIVRFKNDRDWIESQTVKVNDPVEHNGFWFYQAQWDPPDPSRFPGDPGSNGLNYTVLGVGNRNGVHVQLAGCCIAVLGMIYAFYVKPIIKRRRRRRVYEEQAAHSIQEPDHKRQLATATMKVQS